LTVANPYIDFPSLWHSKLESILPDFTIVVDSLDFFPKLGKEEGVILLLQALQKYHEEGHDEETTDNDQGNVDLESPLTGLDGKEALDAEEGEGGG
jgi:hypothetical protein